MKKIYNIEDAIYIAMKEALKSNMREKHGAVLINNNKCISTGYNHELGLKNKQSIHAEEDCIKKCKHKHLFKSSYMVQCRIGFLNKNFDLDNICEYKSKRNTLEKYNDNIVNSNNTIKLKNKPFIMQNDTIIYLKKALPCNNCINWIEANRIRKIYFSY